jgi:hypothetical protein
LGGWATRFVSLGGQIILLNSVLNAIPIFYLSFLKLYGSAQHLLKSRGWCGGFS